MNAPANVTGTYVDVPAGDVAFQAYRVEAPGATRAATELVLLHEIFGITEKIRRYAHDFARYGLGVTVPDLFWRLEPRVELGHDRAGMARALALLELFNEDMAIADIARVIAQVRARSPGCRVALVGFCLGGKLVVRSRLAALADVYVGYYGVGVENIPGNLGGNDAPLMLHYGSDDPHAPRQVVEAYRARLGNAAQVLFYEGAGHAFYLPWKDEASALSRRRTLDFIGVASEAQEGAK